MLANQQAIGLVGCIANHAPFPKGLFHHLLRLDIGQFIEQIIDVATLDQAATVLRWEVYHLI